jgi:hypothetical protein
LDFAELLKRKFLKEKKKVRQVIRGKFEAVGIIQMKK